MFMRPYLTSQHRDTKTSMLILMARFRDMCLPRWQTLEHISHHFMAMGDSWRYNSVQHLPVKGLHPNSSSIVYGQHDHKNSYPN